MSDDWKTHPPFEVSPHLGDNLRRLMGMHRIEQAQLAEAIGMTKQAVWQIASGRNMPRWSTMEKLGAIFGVETSDLLASPEQAVLAGAKAFPTAPIRMQVTHDEIAVVNHPRGGLADDASVIQLHPPEGLTAEEEAQWRKAQQKKPSSGKPGKGSRKT
jgi:transcriptional regulator with XRE-family HTH domain